MTADADVHAKVIYYGPSGAGASENVRYINRKLRADHRGDLRISQAEGGPGGEYEMLPIELGSVGVHKTSIHLYSVPSGDDHAEARRKLLEDVDGIVFVADLRPTRHSATVAALAELRAHLASYGRDLDDPVLIVQYNFRDLADENAVEALHRQLNITTDSVFESVASEGTGVLQTLTSLSKLIVRRIRQRIGLGDSTTQSSPMLPPEAIESAADAAISVEGAKGLSIEVNGPARAERGELSVPIALVEPESGRRIELSLRLRVEGT